MVACEKPVIAAVNGPAAGAGFGLALACDIRLVAASATMTAGYVRRGLSPDAGVSYFLPRHVGLARAADILLTGRDVDAAEAERIGLAAHGRRRTPSFAAAVAATRALAAGAPVAQALTKRLLVRSFDSRSTPRCVTSSSTSSTASPRATWRSHGGVPREANADVHRRVGELVFPVVTLSAP